MKKYVSILLSIVICCAFVPNAFAYNNIDYDDEYAQETINLNSQKQFFEEKYYAMFDLEEDEATIKITYDRDVTPELLKLSETSPVKIQIAEINSVTSDNSMKSRSNTQGWNRAGTYLCDGQYFYVGVELEANVLTKNSREYLQLSKYYLYWNTDNPFLSGSNGNDSNGYCSGTSEEVAIRQFGIKYSTETGGAAAEINRDYGPHGLNLSGITSTENWYNREAYTCDSYGALRSYTTFHIKTADSVVNGVHNDVHYYYIDFNVGGGELP